MAMKLEGPEAIFSQNLFLFTIIILVIFPKHAQSPVHWLFEFQILTDQSLSSYSFRELTNGRPKDLLSSSTLLCFLPHNCYHHSFTMEHQPILAPFPLDSPTCILGPCRSVTDDDIDALLLDQAMAYAPLFCNPKAAFDQPPIIRTWQWTPESENHLDWRSWSYRVEATYGSTWKELYIYSLINFCRHGIILEPNLLAAASSFGVDLSMSFVFRADQCQRRSSTLVP